MSSVHNFLKYYFTFQGRVGRMQYFGGTFFISFLFIVVGLPFVVLARYAENAGQIFTAMLGISIIVLFILSIWANISLTVRRIKDVGMSPWSILLILIPLINVIMNLVLLFIAGDPHETEYGADPIKNHSLSARVAEYTGMIVVSLIFAFFVFVMGAVLFR